jgi:hypothetical protein
MKHSNLYQELGPAYRRRRIWGWIITIAVILFIAFVWYRVAIQKVLADENYGIAVHSCINTARELNQEATIHLDPQSCINNPNYIK